MCIEGSIGAALFQTEKRVIIKLCRNARDPISFHFFIVCQQATAIQVSSPKQMLLQYYRSLLLGGNFAVYVLRSFLVSLFLVICQHVLPFAAGCLTGTPASRNTLTVSVCRSSVPQQARCMGMKPSSCASRVGMPCSISSFAMSGLPWKPAPCYWIKPYCQEMTIRQTLKRKMDIRIPWEYIRLALGC